MSSREWTEATHHERLIQDLLWTIKYHTMCADEARSKLKELSRERECRIVLEE